MPWVRRLRRGPQVEPGVEEPPPPPAARRPARSALRCRLPGGCGANGAGSRAGARRRSATSAASRSRWCAATGFARSSSSSARATSSPSRSGCSSSTGSWSRRAQCRAGRARCQLCALRRAAASGRPFLLALRPPCHRDDGALDLLALRGAAPRRHELLPGLRQRGRCRRVFAETEDLDQTLIRRWSTGEED